MTTSERHRIGAWEFDAGRASLVGPAGEKRLEDRAARTLSMLCRRRGDIVTQAEIIAEIWNGRAISPNSIAVVIADLRRALDDDARKPAHIITLPKRGYSLSARPAPPALPNQQSRSGPLRYFYLAALLLVLVSSINLFRANTAATPRQLIVVVEPVRNETGDAALASLSLALGQLVITQMAKSEAEIIHQSSAVIGQAKGRSIRLSSSLILWNGQPTLSLTATDERTRKVVWAGMAAGPADNLAGTTIAQLKLLTSRFKTI